MEKKFVFLGGTCGESTWREKLIKMLNCSYFNPVVDDWNEEAMNNEFYQRENDDFVLYVLTSQMEGYYSIAEVVDDSNKRPEKTLFCVLEEGFNEKQIRSWNAVKKMVKKNGGMVFDTLEDIAMFLNKKSIENS